MLCAMLLCVKDLGDANSDPYLEYGSLAKDNELCLHSMNNEQVSKDFRDNEQQRCDSLQHRLSNGSMGRCPVILGAL